VKKRCDFQLRFLLDRAGVGPFLLVTLLVISPIFAPPTMCDPPSETRRGGGAGNLALWFEENGLNHSLSHAPALLAARFQRFLVLWFTYYVFHRKEKEKEN
jgi:hypothetical protein